ncbi:MAG: alpha/beta hydrolase [Alkalinema sp. CAN_BIN05]|nr:alpha/beta hydrolase [Alkalinema sp. CAN_BIN05]
MKLIVRGVEHHYDRTQPNDTDELPDPKLLDAKWSESSEPITIVFIHGWLLSRAYWQPVIQRLEGFSCLAYDLRGFGKSFSTKQTAPTQPHLSPEDYTLAAYAQDLEEILDKLGISRVWLVGHSLGGSIALWTAHKMGNRVAGVTCVNAGGGIYLKEEFEKFRNAGQQILKLRSPWMLKFPGLDYLFSRASVIQPIGLELGRQRLLDFIMADPIAARESLLSSTTEAEVHRLPQLLSELTQPVYFIAGQQDTIMEPRYVRHLASFHALFKHCGGNVLELDNCGHLAMVEHPDAVAQQIRDALIHEFSHNVRVEAR